MQVNLNSSPVREQLQQVAQAIRAGDKRAARQILRPLCAANHADAWWLAAQTTDDPQQIRFALEKALVLYPASFYRTGVGTAFLPSGGRTEARPYESLN
jgi:hypothetical protein